MCGDHQVSLCCHTFNINGTTNKENCMFTTTSMFLKFCLYFFNGLTSEEEASEDQGSLPLYTIII